VTDEAIEAFVNTLTLDRTADPARPPAPDALKSATAATATLDLLIGRGAG
jgi:hypothetical protein